MTEQTPPPTSGKLSDRFKTMAIQGLVGVVSLTAAAVIPILAQRFLAPTEITPASTVPGSVPTEVQSQTSTELQRNQPHEEEDDD
jgi:hypothetical protein